MEDILVGGCRSATWLYDLGMTFDIGSARVFLTATFETFSYHKPIWIAASESPKLQIYWIHPCHAAVVHFDLCG